MYIELFILDNIVMNLLIIRFAACVLGTKPVWSFAWIVAFVGAIYSACATQYPILLALPMKILLCGVMALALPMKKAADFFVAQLSVLFATAGIGGVCCFIAFCSGGNMNNGVLFVGVPFRMLAYFAIAATFAPNIFRRLQRRRMKSNIALRLEYVVCKRKYKLHAIVDTGNLLYDIVSALPVVIVPKADKNELQKIPIPYHGVGGNGTLFAFRPDSICVDGVEIDALIAPSDSAIRYALIPITALPTCLADTHDISAHDIGAHDIGIPDIDTTDVDTPDIGAFG